MPANGSALTDFTPNPTNTMKRTLLFILAVSSLTSCQNPANTQKVVTISQIGLDILVAKKVIKPEDAETIKATGQVFIAPAPSGK